MRQKLRTDITKKLSFVSALMVNLAVFYSSNPKSDMINNIVSLLDQLGSINVNVFGYSTKNNKLPKALARLDIEKIAINSNRAYDIFSKTDTNHTLNDVVLFGFENEDIELIKSARFGVTAFNAPLEVKMESDYVSNFEGINAFEELCNLIINAKREPFGFSN